jgi:hypothetical protein
VYGYGIPSTGMKHVIQNFYQTKNLDRQLDRLRTSGKQGVMAARRAEQIIKILLRYSGAETEELRSKRTKHGELRLKNCRKYDLGGGYRLLSLRNENHLIFVYVGTHDECHLWLETHRDISLDAAIFVESFITLTVPQVHEPPECAEIMQVSSEPDQYEEELLARLDEKILGHVFRGLVR